VHYVSPKDAIVVSGLQNQIWHLWISKYMKDLPENALIKCSNIIKETKKQQILELRK
jgi:hypothetical protein